MLSDLVRNLQVQVVRSLHNQFDEFFAVGSDVYATFSPWASWMSVGNPFGMTPWAIGSFPVSGGTITITQAVPGSVVAVTSGGLTINLIFDAAAMAAPASFREGIQQAAAILCASISDKITVNLKIDCSGTGGGAAAGPDHGLYESYSLVRSNLINNASPGDTIFNALPAGTSVQGQSSVAVWNAQLKLWGLMGANDTATDDGSATFATDISPNLLVGVALHELTHALGRIPYGSQPDVFDLFRFTSPGTRLFLNGATAPAAYFSVDGGITKSADYGRNSDASDFLNSGVQGPSDPFNEYYTPTTSQQLTAADLQQLNALGFHLVTPDTKAPLLIADNPLSIQAGTMQTITSGLLSATDNVSPAAQLLYTVTSAPTRGTVLLNGMATSTFTQADIDNGLVSYHEFAAAVTSDSFSFRIADAAGNATSTASFAINIDSQNHAPTGETLSGGVIAENSSNGTLVGNVTGVDSDPGTVFQYSLLDDADVRFAIDAGTGRLTVADGARLDYEIASSHGIVVHAVDQGGLFIDRSFKIQLTDVSGVILTGDGGNNVLTGTPEPDTINGLNGNDTLAGGGGNDALDGGLGVDTAVFTGVRADYLVSYNSSDHSFSVEDQRPGSPDGLDRVINVEQFQFADSVSVHNFDASGALVSETFNAANGTRWTNTFDAVGNQTYVWSTNSYDASGNLITQNGLNHDGTHWLTMYDVNNLYSWTNATITFDAQWMQTSVTGVSDDGSTTVTMNDIAPAYDTTTWYATPFGTHLNPDVPSAPSGTSIVNQQLPASCGVTDGFKFNFADAKPASAADFVFNLDHVVSDIRGVFAGLEATSLGAVLNELFASDHALDATLAHLPGTSPLHPADFLLA